MDIPFFNDIGEKLRGMMGKVKEKGQFLMVVEPVHPYNNKGMVTALITAAGLISVAILAGVSLVSLAVMLAALGLILLILTRVFGVDLNFNPEDIFGY